MNTKNKKMYQFLSLLCLAVFVCSAATGCNRDLRVYETVTGDDGSKWEQVSRPGFGDESNVSIVSMAEFQDSLYAVTRNDDSGFEIWSTNRFGRWDKLRVPDFTNSVFHDFMNNVWGDLIVFQDKLYIAVSSGFQGSRLYKSVGFEIWRYDGRRWEAVVSHTLGPQVEGRISSLASCSAGDGSSTAEFTDSGASWTVDQFKDGILWITSGGGKGRTFDIVGNTATTLTVQQNETAGTAEDTVCDNQTFTADPPFPPYTVGTIEKRDTYKIIKGVTANGFGELWNKSIVDLEEYNGELYASVGFNYEKGARVWKSADGATWEPSSDYSMGSYHGYDPEGNPSGICLIPGLESRNGQPVSSSLPRFGKLSVNGEETLLIGGTGTGGCNGRGLRIFRLSDNDSWQAIVDYFVDTNDNGTNENGIGDDGSSGAGFTSSNFQAWSWAMYDDKLFTGIGRLTGGRMMYTANADPADGNWQYAVGGDAAEPEGFGYNPNIVLNIFTLNSTTLIAGTSEDESFAAPVIDEQRGADIWWATGASDNLTWTQVTKDAFGDQTIIQFEAPRLFFDDQFFISASSYGPSTPLNGGREGYTGAKVYRLASELK
ncbi:MAG: hypothetical protein JW832_14460 [Deltaproteobacteria bacterium]|nr:hypothetical protein [Deltaproteobacteria bacterium]